MCTLSMDRWGRPELGPRRIAATATRHESPAALVPLSSPLFKSAELMRRTSSARCGSAHHACQVHRRGCGRRVVLLDAVGRGDHAHGGLRCLEAPLVLILLRPPEHVPPGDRGAAAGHRRGSRPGRLEPPKSRRGGHRRRRSTPPPARGRRDRDGAGAMEGGGRRRRERRSRRHTPAAAHAQSALWLYGSKKEKNFPFKPPLFPPFSIRHLVSS